MHLDLLRELAPRLEQEPALRRRLYRYLHGAADNVSSLHSGLLYILLARLSTSAGEDEILTLTETLDLASYPELENFPNRALVNAHDPAMGPLSASTGLAEKYQHLRDDSSCHQFEAKAAKQLARLRNQLLRSRWIALGRAFGACRNLSADAGKNPQEKLQNLRRAVDESKWLKLGSKLGAYKS